MCINTFIHYSWILIYNYSNLLLPVKLKLSQCLENISGLVWFFFGKDIKGLSEKEKSLSLRKWRPFHSLNPHFKRQSSRSSIYSAKMKVDTLSKYSLKKQILITTSELISCKVGSYLKQNDNVNLHWHCREHKLDLYR